MSVIEGELRGLGAIQSGRHGPDATITFLRIGHQTWLRVVMDARLVAPLRDGLHAGQATRLWVSKGWLGSTLRINGVQVGDCSRYYAAARPAAHVPALLWLAAAYGAAQWHVGLGGLFFGLAAGCWIDVLIRQSRMASAGGVKV